MTRTMGAGFFCLILLCYLAEPVSAQGMVLKDLKDRDVPLDSLLTGGPVVLNFWATWCTPCRVEMPHLEKIYKELAPQGVRFAAISLDTKRNKKRVEQYLKKYGITIPIYRDLERTVARKFKVMAIPTTVVLDQDGTIRYRTRGYRPGDEVMLRKKIQALIKESAKSGAAKTEGQ